MYPFLDSPLESQIVESPKSVITDESTKDCVDCRGETGGAHKCPGCDKFIHAICGRQVGEEGYGSSLWCAACDLSTKNEMRKFNAHKRNAITEC